MTADHDSSYKFLLSTPELVRDLILGFIPDDWLHSLDYDTLEKVPGSYITEDYSRPRRWHRLARQGGRAMGLPLLAD